MTGAMTEPELHLLLMLAESRAQHGGVIDARMVVMAIQTLLAQLAKTKQKLAISITKEA